MYEVAVKAIILWQNDVLLLQKTKKEKKDDADDNSFDLPGGRLKGKENIDEGLKREIREETGLDVIFSNIFEASTIENKAGVQIVMLYYVCRCANSTVLLSEEHEAYFWVDKNVILVRDDIPEWIKKLVEKLSD